MKKTWEWALVLGIVAIGVAMPLAGCHDDDDDCSAASFRQIERLGRPAVNEGLIVTNDFLNAFNTIPPTADLSPAAAPVVNEAVTTLTAFGNSAARVNDIATAFLPDTMRIDTTIASGYASGAISVGVLGVVRPVGGRKLTDDVIDITLSVLTNGAITTDNVDYDGEPGNAAQPGHQPVLGSFPYLANPN